MFSDLFLGWRTRNNNRQYTYTQTHRTPHTAPRKWKKNKKQNKNFEFNFLNDDENGMRWRPVRRARVQTAQSLETDWCNAAELSSERVRKKKKKMEGGGKIEKEKKKCQLDSPPLSLSHHPLWLYSRLFFWGNRKREREEKYIHHQRDVLQEDGYT